jgi:hypothetical protein
MFASNAERPSSRPLFLWDVEVIVGNRGGCEKAVRYTRGEETPETYYPKAEMSGDLIMARLVRA